MLSSDVYDNSWMSEAMNESWGELAEFIAHRHSIDIGALNRLLVLCQHSQAEEAVLAKQAQAFLETVSIAAKAAPQLHLQALALMALDALLFNLFRLVRGGQNFRPANSSFYGWMSMSQLSGDYSESSNTHEHPRRMVLLLEHLANCEPLFRRIKLILDRPSNRQRNHRYADNLLETLDYVLSRQKCPRDNFLRLRSKLGVTPVKNRPIVEFVKVNEVIFSNQLNKICRLLTEGSDELHLALVRVYAAEAEEGERKQFEGRVLGGAQMMHNLHRYYVESFQDEQDLFQESKHPLFRLIRNQLIQFYSPFFISFHAAVGRLGLAGEHESAWGFYKGNESVVREQLVRVVRSMPGELVDLLRSLSRIIQEVFRIKREACIALVKKLLFYSFLCSQPLIEDLLPRLDPNKYLPVYNHVLNLFFQTSIRKFSDLPPQKLGLVTALVEEVASALDERIESGGSQVLEEQGEPTELIFRIKDPILNYDYELLLLALQEIEFTPKDMKKFPMADPREQATESPVYKHFRKEASVVLQQDPATEDIAAWMSVGGSRDWGKTNTNKSDCHRSSVKERLQGLTTLRGEKVRELNQLRGQFEQYLPE